MEEEGSIETLATTSLKPPVRRIFSLRASILPFTK